MNETKKKTEGEQSGPGLCRDLSKWEALLFERRARVAGAVRDAVQGGPLPERDALDLGADLFGRLYGDPKQVDGPTWAEKAHEAVDSLPEFAALRERVAGDPDLAAIAAAEILSAVSKTADESRKAEADPKWKAEKGQAPIADRLRAALRGAVRTASQRVDETAEALAGIAPGLASVPPQHEQADPKRFTLANRVRKDRRLQEILRRSGRLLRSADARDRARSVHAREEVVDLERGADLGRVLPAQLARLRHPALRALALRDLVERQAIQYRLEGSEPLERGPIVVLLDESGSMGGDPHDWARAVGIACLGVASKERRPATVVGFDGGIRSIVHLDADGVAWSYSHRYRTDRTPVACEPTRLGDVGDAVLFVAAQGCPGGTDYAPAFRLALAGLPRGVADERADLVLVTDGAAELDEDLRAAVERLRAEKGLRVRALTLNGGSASGTVQALCDVVVDLDRAPSKDAAATVLP